MGRMCSVGVVFTVLCHCRGDLCQLDCVLQRDKYLLVRSNWSLRKGRISRSIWPTYPLVSDAVDIFHDHHSLHYRGVSSRIWGCLIYFAKRCQNLVHRFSLCTCQEDRWPLGEGPGRRSRFKYKNSQFKKWTLFYVPDSMIWQIHSCN